MSNQLLTDYFRLHIANQFKESITEVANSVYYVFAGRSTPFANGDVVTAPENTVNEYDIGSQDNMLFGKRVQAEDVSVVIPRYDWTANTVYTAYRADVDLSDKRYFACVNSAAQYHVFKVLDNNGGAPSTVAPALEDTSADDEYYATSDGYVWKYMYTIPKTLYDKFATKDFIPVVVNANVVANAVPGAIDVVEITYPGSHFNSYTNGAFTVTDLRVGGNPRVLNIANTASGTDGYYEGCYIYLTSGTGQGQYRRIDQYNVAGTQKLITINEAFTVSPDVTTTYEINPAVTITGDGSGAAARAVINAEQANSVKRVEILDRGSNYTWASANLVSQTDGFSNTSLLTPVMSPRNGHGSDPEAELQGTNIGISVTFANTEGNTIPTVNDYRTIGILKDPQYANVTLFFDSVDGLFEIGESLYQQSTRAEGIVIATDETSYVTISNVVGVFASSANLVGYTSNATANVSSFEINGSSKGFDTFDQRVKLTYSAPSVVSFAEDEMIYQLDPAVSNAVFHSIDDNYIYLTNLRGSVNTGAQIIGSNSGAFATLLSKYAGDLIHGSGEVLYIENTDPVTRSNTQSEVIKIVLKF